MLCRWGFLLSSRQHNGRGSSRHLFRTRKRSSERVSNLPKDTQLQSIRSARAGGRSWKAVPGKGEEGLCIPARLQGSGQLRATEIPSLTVLGASCPRAGCWLPARGLPAALGAAWLVDASPRLPHHVAAPCVSVFTHRPSRRMYPHWVRTHPHDLTSASYIYSHPVPRKVTF